MLRELLGLLLRHVVDAEELIVAENYLVYWIHQPSDSVMRE